MRWGFWSLLLQFAVCLQRGSGTSLLQRGGLRKARAPDLWAETAGQDHIPGLTNELELTRTAGDGWYTASLGIGGNTSQVIVDTGSPWLWSYAGGSGASGEEGAESFSINYLSANLAGTVVKESLSLHAAKPAGQCKAGKATNGDPFWLKQYKTSGVQGVLGLACGTADSGSGAEAAKGLQTGLGCMSAALDAESGGGAVSGTSVFALRLTAQGGTLSFGETPFELLRGLVRMPPSMQCGNWRAPVRVSLGGKEFGFSEATLDSAAPGIVGLSEHVASLAEALGAKIDIRDGGMVFVLPCSRAGELPVVELRLGQGREATVQLAGEDLVIPDDSASSAAEGGGKQCKLALHAWDSPQWILGMPFFRAVRGVVFNPFTQSVSIAP